MCGICGIIDYNRDNLVEEERLRKMCQELKHRGPDDEGIYIKKDKVCIGLGHRRLSIIDLSAEGHQPISNEGKDIWMVFNGEVYNFQELRHGLKGKGHIFKSNTDCEVVIHLYEEYGQECVDYIRGMFAFAVWDEKRKILFAARDRLGKKPFFYSYHNGRLCFASELTALLASGLVEKEVNLEAIDYYLTLGYIPAPFSIYKTVSKLPPAHILQLKDGKITFRQYWKLDYAEKIKISEREACEEILRLLKEATRVRLYSDVPLGAFLSGGIDSSTIVGIMSQISPGKIKTFSIGFEEEGYSELSYSRKIADKFGTEHYEFMVRPQALKILPLLVERYGEPYADSSCIPTYYVSEQTKKYVTVALNGDGGDENFSGYERYQAMKASQIYQNFPGIIKKTCEAVISALPDSLEPKNKLRRIKRFFQGVNLPLEKRYLRWIGIFDEGLQNKLYSTHFRDRLTKEQPLGWLSQYLNNYPRLDLTDTLLMTDVNSNLAYDLLVKMDIASMANSLETRSPFLDQEFMEFTARLPSEYKMKGFVKKYILKKTVKNILPKANIYRSKMGFGIPVGSWFRQDLKEFVKEMLLSEPSLKRGYFQPEALRVIVLDHTEGRKDYTFQLWALLMLELWHKRFID